MPCSTSGTPGNRDHAVNPRTAEQGLSRKAGLPQLRRKPTRPLWRRSGQSQLPPASSTSLARRPTLSSSECREAVTERARKSTVCTRCFYGQARGSTQRTTVTATSPRPGRLRDAPLQWNLPPPSGEGQSTTQDDLDGAVRGQSHEQAHP